MTPILTPLELALIQTLQQASALIHIGRVHTAQEILTQTLAEVERNCNPQPTTNGEPQ